MGNLHRLFEGIEKFKKEGLEEDVERPEDFITMKLEAFKNQADVEKVEAPVVLVK